jgi:hypothetical protein
LRERANTREGMNTRKDVVTSRSLEICKEVTTGSVADYCHQVECRTSCAGRLVGAGHAV